uniref:sec-independent protein translocase n=1 Tax=Cryptomonas pyrenoidifera TaxID=233184 RepID=UPI00226D3B7F|nr:sec-independent protein translocase [Cryptomonas pyrenoidifera]UZP15122.1 sec-independent protein translocase [Cryptomonas pyrenoidifera]
MFNFTKHLKEFTSILSYICISFLLTFFTSYLFAPQIIKILSSPLSNYIKTEEYDFIFTNIFEVFSTYITIAFYSAIFLNIPLSLYLIYLFVKPGLFKYEKDFLILIFKTFIKFIFFSTFFTYYLVLPSILSFLLNIDLVINSSFIVLKMETKLYDYVVFFYNLIFLYCFIIFQIPSLLIIFVYIKQPHLISFYKKRRFFILISFIIGCIFSSPDLISLFIVSMPLIFFFECVIFVFILKDNYKHL